MQGAALWCRNACRIHVHIPVHTTGLHMKVRGHRDSTMGKAIEAGKRASVVSALPFFKFVRPLGLLSNISHRLST
jgi:hypothetical protein